jgi:hypothetical protein
MRKRSLGSAESTALMKLFAKNSPEGFAIHRLTCAGGILLQRIINKCLATMARLFSPDPKGIDYIIIQVNGDSGLTPGERGRILLFEYIRAKKRPVRPFFHFLNPAVNPSITVSELSPVNLK